ncbi:hypothetical protein [Falsihalocynthiibacter arcticus]|uniref:hypothetical protein n=1 Tax=Falsihalocynthiibacter arcticus TaxID=1579316 RepID=UPI0005799C79|nr:hypothetical protein [Falsihalocynthiibacter arcticus]
MGTAILLDILSVVLIDQMQRFETMKKDGARSLGSAAHVHSLPAFALMLSLHRDASFEVS